jgi:L-malate glycosyltransferase
MNDFIELRRKLYYNTDFEDLDSCIDSNTLLFEKLIERGGFERDFYKACILVKSLAEMDNPPAGYGGELSKYLLRSTVYDRLYSDYRMKIGEEDLSSKADFSEIPALVRETVSLAEGYDNEPSFSLFQFLYHGDPLQAGTGNSGGAATFIRDLGDALCRLNKSCRVTTLIPAKEISKDLRFLDSLGERHILVRVPMALPSVDPSGFIEYQHRIEMSLEVLMRELIRKPDIVHLRFIDAASLASARTARKLRVPVIVTLTPDPHRTICDPEGAIKQVPPDTGLVLIHRIYAGDTLVKIADGIVGIGRESLRNELIHYFPQLEDLVTMRIKTIDEGIKTEVGQAGVDIAALVTAKTLPHRIDPEMIQRPFIINVGRLNPIKGQRSLVLAWGRSQIWKTYNLLLIGGNFRTPDINEADFIDFLEGFMTERPHLSGRLAHLQAQPNGVIRSVQKTFGKKRFDTHPDVYLCSSIKEEFGISILEAMQAEMVVFAPIRGGAGGYINHGVNGFLMDTSSSDTISDEFSAYIYRSTFSRAQFESIKRNAGETIRRHYSIESVSSQYYNFYREVLDGKKR